MKINKTFVRERGDDWERIRTSHQAFNKDRWRWREIVRRTRVSAAAKDVALSLVDKFGGGEDGRIYPSHAALAADTGLDERTVRAAVSKLHDAGLIVTMSRGSTSTLYFFADPTDTTMTVESDREQDGNRHVRDAKTDINVTVRESQTCQSDRHVCDANHDHLSCPHNMATEHDALMSCDGAPAVQEDLPLVDHPSFGPVGPQGAEVPREDQIDELLAIAIRDADDTDILPLRHQEIREAIARRYGSAMEHQWWVVAEWFSGNLEWIDAISELEKGEYYGEEEVQHAHG